MPEPTPINAAAGTPWPEPPGEAIYHGLAGEIVRELLPHTEADAVGLLATFLACVGNALGTGPHYRVGGARHELRLYPVLVGATSSGRKGTAIDTLAPLFQAALPDWWARQSKGMVSGEGLIYHVRDATTEHKPRKNMGVVIDKDAEVVTDPGAADKRLLIIEKEFGGVLRVMTRESNTLSTVIRDAWDGGIMATLAKNAPVRATGAHITILGHITPEELRDLLTSTDAQNGFANRFMWLCVTRSKLLPFGGELADDALLGMARVLEGALADATALRRITLTDAAKDAWVRVYEPLTTPDAGLVGVILGRAAPYVMRVAATYAALDGTAEIDDTHLAAALALWDYAAASVRHIFGVGGAATTASPYRESILIALAGGRMTQTEITRKLFGGNLPAGEPRATLDRLLTAELIDRESERPASGKGNSTTYWVLTERGRLEANR